MDAQIVAIFCLCDDILKELHHPEDIQRKMSDAEVMTTSIVVATFSAGNMETARIFLKEQGYILNMLGKSCLNRRQHRIADLFLTVFNLLGTLWKRLNDKVSTSWIAFLWLLVTTTEFHARVVIWTKTGAATKPEKNAAFMA